MATISFPPDDDRSRSGRADSQTRRARMESREAAIVEAAHELFGEKGFSKATIAGIARQAGVAEGTVYLYFNNKEALAAAVIASFYEKLTDTARAGVTQFETTRDKLSFLAEHHLTSVIEERRILELLSVLDRHVTAEGGSAIYTMNKRYVAIFDEVVREGVWRGEIASVFTPWILRDIFYGGLEYAMRTILLTGREGQVHKVTQELVTLVTGPAITPPGEQVEERAGEEGMSQGISQNASQRASQQCETDADPNAQLLKLADRMDAIADRMENALPPGVSPDDVRHSPRTMRSKKARNPKS